MHIVKDCVCMCVCVCVCVCVVTWALIEMQSFIIYGSNCSQSYSYDKQQLVPQYLLSFEAVCVCWNAVTN